MLLAPQLCLQPHLPQRLRFHAPQLCCKSRNPIPGSIRPMTCLFRAVCGADLPAKPATHSLKDRHKAMAGQRG
jgi:hypothetical protein